MVSLAAERALESIPLLLDSASADAWGHYGPVRVSVDIDAPSEEVWRQASDLASHAEWMADALSVNFVGDLRQGVGTRLAVKTRFGPILTTDLLEVTAWEPPHRIVVTHRGMVKGEGQLVVEPLGEGRTRFSWEERLRFPWLLGGPIGEWVVRPLLRHIMHGNLQRFRRSFS
jgi:uncharacterized protein YndB with AHSA1/START domain